MSKVEKNHDLKKKNWGNCLNRGCMIFAYIKTLDNVHKASPPVVASFVLERKACCVSVAVAVLIIVC